MATCFDVADYFIANADKDEGISNLKLQKLCAYAQAFSVTLNKSTLFSNNLEVWPHGPVVVELYNTYKMYGKNPLSTSVLSEESRNGFSEKELYILETINNYYGRFAAWELRNMSHEDFPGDFENPNRQIIPIEDLISTFSQNKVVEAIESI